MRRSALAHLDTPVAADPLELQGFLLTVALAATASGVVANPVVRGPDVPTPVPPLSTLATRIRNLAIPGGDALPKGWQSVLFLRFARFRAEATSAGGGRYWFAAVFRLWVARLPLPRGARLDPETPRWVRFALQPWRVLTGR
jgi:hypothetical protein